MFDRVRSLLELIRFSHTLFALPFALIGAVLAWQDVPFRWSDLVGILLCMVFARSTAMAFNRLADRHHDATNPRTAGRHLPTGKLSAAAVWVFTLASAAAFIASTAIFLGADPPNPWPLWLAVPTVLFIWAYSLTKRFTALSHFWLGASLFCAPAGGWVALRGMEQLAYPIVLGLAVLFWVAGFDILYACQDEAFDRRANLHSLPARFGARASLRLAAVCHLLMVVMLALLYLVDQASGRPHLGWIYLAGVAAVAALLVYEHRLVRPDDLSRVNRAFFQVNGVISVGLLAVVLLDLYWR
jgi:4-hydroxybenzoate polyprenyltransferase